MQPHRHTGATGAGKSLAPAVRADQIQPPDLNGFLEQIRQSHDYLLMKRIARLGRNAPRYVQAVWRASDRLATKLKIAPKNRAMNQP